MAVRLTTTKYRLAVFRGGSIPFELRPLWDKEGDLVCAQKGILVPPPPWKHSDSRYDVASGKVCDDEGSGIRPSEIMVMEVTGRGREVLVVDPYGLMELHKVIVVEQLQAVEASPQGQLREAIEHLESAISGLDHGREASAINTNLLVAKEIVGLVQADHKRANR